MSEPPEPDNLLELLRASGYDAYDMLAGETLPQFLERIHRDHPLRKEEQ